MKSVSIIYSYFEKGSRKKCAYVNPEGNMESHQYTVPDTVAVEPTFLLSFSTRKHASIASRVILSNFFEGQ